MEVVIFRSPSNRLEGLTHCLPVSSVFCDGIRTASSAGDPRMFRSALITLVLVAVAVPSLAQQQPATGPTTREETIAAERNDKVAELWPERTSPIVDRANRLVERGFREGLDSGKGANGPQIVLGGMRSGQGFTAGMGYRRSDLWAERLGYRATGAGNVAARLSVRLQSRFPGPQDRTNQRSGGTRSTRAPLTSISTGSETTVPRKTTPAFRMTT